MTLANTIWRYRIAGNIVESNLFFADLLPIRHNDHPSPDAESPCPDHLVANPVWCGEEIETTIHDYQVVLRFATADGIDLVSLGEGKTILIDHRKHVITVDLAGIDQGIVQHLVLGPALGLLFARQDLWMMHASAIRLPSTTILFCGRSGAGKSTLAQQLESSRTDCIRVADDITVFRYEDNKPPLVMPDFPQPRLGPDQQPDRELVPHPAGLICVLSGDAGEAVTLSPMNEVDACLGIVNHMMGSSIPVPWLQQKLLHRAAGIARYCKVHTLQYPHIPNAIPRVGACLDDLLDSGS